MAIPIISAIANVSEIGDRKNQINQPIKIYGNTSNAIITTNVANPIIIANIDKTNPISASIIF